MVVDPWRFGSLLVQDLLSNFLTARTLTSTVGCPPFEIQIPRHRRLTEDDTSSTTSRPRSDYYRRRSNLSSRGACWFSARSSASRHRVVSMRRSFPVLPTRVTCCNDGIRSGHHDWWHDTHICAHYERRLQLSQLPGACCSVRTVRRSLHDMMA